MTAEGYVDGATDRRYNVMSFGGFSWKRAMGVSTAKRKIAKATGIPTTKAGRKRKAQNMLWNAIANGKGKK